MKLKVVADDKIPFLKGILEPYADVVYLPGGAISKDDLVSADALLTRTRTKCNAKLLDGTSVRFIASATIGTDHIDHKYCSSNSIIVSNAPGCNAASVAQYIASVLVCDAKENSIPLRGRTMGVIGVGHVGRLVAELGLKLGMRVLLNDPPRERVEGSANFSPLSKILAESDIVTLHTPLSSDGVDRTFHLANAEFFLSLAKRPLFINASRGEVVSSDALKSALITKHIRSAAIDVWENEPDIDSELLPLVRYATPHIAGYSADGKANGTSMAVRALAKFFGIGELETFRVRNIPSPPNPILRFESDLTALYDAVTASYDVRKDNSLFRNDPESFEKIRNDYALRREFGAFAIDGASQIQSRTSSLLASLGFKTV